MQNTFSHWYRQNLQVDISSGDWVTHATSAGHALGLRGSPQEVAKGFKRILKRGELDQFVKWKWLDCGGTIFAAPSNELSEEEGIRRSRRTSGLNQGHHGVKGGHLRKVTHVNSGTIVAD